jgi:hypothetical protein
VDSGELSSLRSVLDVLTALIAPALLITATAAFVSSTSIRLSNNIEYARRVAQVLREVRGRDGTSRQTQTGWWLEHQLEVTYRRVRLEQEALALYYGATIMFVACSLVLGMEAMRAFLHYWLPVALGICGVLFLLAASALLILDVQLMAKLMHQELARIRSDLESQFAAGPSPSD